MKCKICKTKSEKVFSHKIINKYTVAYYKCNNCGFIQTEKPFWLKEAYENAINDSDTGLISRNIKISQITANIISFFFKSEEKFVDFAGGYGMFTRMMRDIGFDYYHYDPYCQNLFSETFDVRKWKAKDTFELATAIEVFEHFSNPLKEIKNILKNTNDNILFTTTLLPSDIPDPELWWYYGFEHGQHIAFYSHKTLLEISNKFNLNLYTDKKALHLLTKKQINSSLFNLMVKNYYAIYPFIKRKYKSLTVADHDQVAQQIIKENI